MVTNIEVLLFAGRDSTVPPDARSLASAHLRQIEARITALLPAPPRAAAPAVQIDPQSRAHLEEIRQQIEKVFRATLEMPEP
jgi:hypothetical protein